MDPTAARHVATILAAALLFTGCRDVDPKAPTGPVAPSQEAGTSAVAEPGAVRWTEGITLPGSWRVRWRSEPAPIAFGQPARIVVAVEGLAPADQPLEGVALAFDAGMPDHGHGMSRVPLVRRVDPGRFEVEGVLLHMPGTWELYLDVGLHGVWERARFPLEVD